MDANQTHGRRGRVLVVDDEPLICEVLRMMLEEKHDVVTVTSGAEAKALLETDESFDVILCDLMMANMSGIDLHHWLLQAKPQVAARMVFMTGGAYTEVSRKFLDEVPNPTISKPLDWNKVEETVSSFVAQNG